MKRSRLAVDKNITLTKEKGKSGTYLKYKIIRKEGNEDVLKLESQTHMESAILEIS